MATTSCSSCGAPDEEGRFCSRCGTALPGNTTSAPEQVSAIALHPVAERRVTSVLFGDLVGFTPMSESRDPEEVRDLLSRYFAECRTVIGRYNGVIEKFIGDAVMAVWGVPVAHEDDAERAVRAGLELVSMVAGLGEDVGIPELAIRVGIVTGEVAVTIGATAEGMVAGDVVNTAARVQSAAQPGQVWVDETTRSLTAAAIAYDDAGEHLLKGKTGRTHLWAAGAVVGEVGGGRRGDGLQAPLAGRDRELRLLKELFLATAESQRPRLVILDGEAGIGKSRLAWELQKYSDGLSATVRWHQGRCLSYGEGVTFWALSEAVRARLGLTDAGEVVGEQLEAGLEAFVPDLEERDWLRPRLAALVQSSQGSGYTRSELFVAWTTWFERVGADDSAVVLVIDDAQHAEEGLLDFLEHLLASARSGIFVLALARPELLVQRPSLGGRRTSVIRLDPLDDIAMAQLADGLVVGLSERSRAALVRRAEGIPLFAVETVRALIDRDAVVPRGGVYVPAEGSVLDLDSIGAPASLQALVAARIDALSPDERRVVADASVLGAAFTHQGLLALGSNPAVLDACLDSLQVKEIVAVEQDRFAADRGHFRFVQSVVRQIAYGTQGRVDRKVRHLSAADYLSGLPDADGDLAVVIAQHLIDAFTASAAADEDVQSLSDRACVQLEKAALRARTLGSSAEAQRLFTSALERAADPATQARLNFQAASSASAAGDYAGAIAFAAASAALFDALDLPLDAAIAVAMEAGSLQNTSQPRAAIALATPRWRLVEGIEGGELAMIRLAQTLSSSHIDLGEPADAWQHTQQWIHYAEALGEPEHIAQAMLSLASGYANSGAPATACALVETAARLARAHDCKDVLARALNNLAAVYTSRDLAAAEANAREGLDVARRGGMGMLSDYTALNLIIALWTSGQLVEANSLIQESLERISVPSILILMQAVEHRLADALGTPLPPLPGQGNSEHAVEFYAWSDIAIHHALAAGDGVRAADLAEASLPHVLANMNIDDDFMMLWPPMIRACIAANDVVRAEQILAPVESASSGIVSPGVDAQWHWMRGLVAALRGDNPNEVEAKLRKGIAALDKFGARGYRAQAQEDLARWLESQHRAGDAAPLIEDARTTYAEIGATGWLSRLNSWQAAHQTA